MGPWNLHPGGSDTGGPHSESHYSDALHVRQSQDPDNFPGRDTLPWKDEETSRFAGEN